MLSNHRKSELSEIAGSYTSEFHTNGIPDLNLIAKSEDIKIIYDHYNRSFEGMTVCEEADFFIHIDLDSISTKDNPRSRFTLAHELGHAIIDEHRLGLLTGELEPHSSFFLLGESKSLIEKEADYFASCILMPWPEFLEVSKKFSRPFTINSIKQIASQFNVSILAALIRFVDYGSHPIFVVYCKENKVVWYSKSNDFPSWAYKFKVEGIIPKETVLGDFISNKRNKYDEPIPHDPESWFFVKWDMNMEFYEQCIYSDDYGYNISVMWFGK